MRDPFDAPLDFVNVDGQSLSEPTRPTMMPTRANYVLGNGTSGPWTPNSDSLVRHQVQTVSISTNLREDVNTRLLDPEIMELHSRSRSQEEEILLLRKKIADACLNELRLLHEKHILERKLSELRMAFDEKQDDAISGTLKELTQKKSHLEENLKLANELKVAEEEVYIFTSSLLGLLAEYDVRPSLINASTVAIGTKRLYQHMQLKIRTSNGGDRYGPADIFENNIGEGANGGLSADPQNLMPATHVDQASSVDGEISLPSIESFQIVGEARPGFRLQACGFPTNGTTLCVFQWVRFLPNGTGQYIEGATLPEYVVTADDVDTLLAVDCTPMDDNGNQGELVRQYANNQNKITCDPEMQHEIDTYISTGKAAFGLLLLVDPSDGWESAILILKRSGYQIKVKRTEEVVVEEKYSHDLCIKVPYGSSTQFVLICSNGVSLPFSTDGTSQEYTTEQDIKLRDLIVLTMRIFQNKALDGKRKGKA